MIPKMQAPLLMALGLLLAGPAARARVHLNQVSPPLLSVAASSLPAQLGWDYGGGYSAF